MLKKLLILLIALSFAACGGEDHDDHDHGEGGAMVKVARSGEGGAPGEGGALVKVAQPVKAARARVQLVHCVQTKAAERCGCLCMAR